MVSNLQEEVRECAYGYMGRSSGLSKGNAACQGLKARAFLSCSQNSKEASVAGAV